MTLIVAIVNFLTLCTWFYCNLYRLYQPVHFLGMWLQMVIVIVQLPGRYLTRCSPQLIFFLSTVGSALQFFMVFSINFMTDILDIWVYYPAFSVSFCSPCGYVDQCIVNLQFILFSCSILSVPRGTVFDLVANSKCPHWFEPSVFSTPSVGKLWVRICWGRFLLFGSFCIRVVFYFDHWFQCACFFPASFHFDSQSVVDGSEYFKPESSFMARRFPICCFFECCSEWILVYFRIIF